MLVDALQLISGLAVTGAFVFAIPATFLSGFAEPDPGDPADGPLEDGHGADGGDQL